MLKKFYKFVEMNILKELKVPLSRWQPISIAKKTMLTFFKKLTIGIQVLPHLQWTLIIIWGNTPEFCKVTQMAGLSVLVMKD